MTSLKNSIDIYLELINPANQSNLSAEDFAIVVNRIPKLYQEILVDISSLKNLTAATVEDVSVGTNEEQYISPKVLAEILTTLPTSDFDTNWILAASDLIRTQKVIIKTVLNQK